MAKRNPARPGLLAAALAVACAAAHAPLPEPSPGPPPEPGSLRATLLFDGAVDLDLYVTGPDQETVYFANTPSRAGGALERDWRCDGTAGARLERVTFPDAAPGRYRVGVDFPERCRDVSGPVPFALTVEGPGVRRERRGAIALGHFLPRVLEVDVAAAPVSRPRPPP